MQEYGIRLFNGWGSVVTVAHLYEACRQGGYLGKTWPDMELIMDILTREKLFAGRVPKSPEEAFKTASLMIGISAMTFAKNRRLDNCKRAKAGLKVLTPKSPVADLFRKQFSGDGPDTTHLTLAKVGVLLEDRAVASNSLTTDCANEQGCLRQQWTTSHKLTVLQLLETMRDANAAEQHILRFDYFNDVLPFFVNYGLPSMRSFVKHGDRIGLRRNSICWSLRGISSCWLRKQAKCWRN